MEKRNILTICILVMAIVLSHGEVSKAAGWLEMPKLFASDGAEYNYFGLSVSISGDYAVVGAPHAGDDTGYAYIFKRDGFTWNQEAKLVVTGGRRFGSSVFISGDYAIVGAPYSGDADGAAYIFKRNGTTWSQEASLIGSDTRTNDYFGSSVSISGDYAIVGVEAFNDYTGAAYIFKRDGTTWSQEAKIAGSDTDFSDAFGGSVSIVGDLAIVGAYGHDVNGISSGAAYIFRRDGTTWNQEAELAASDGAEYDNFGGSVSISGDSAIIGARNNNDKGNSSGSAYIFKYDGLTWTEQAKLLDSNGVAYEFFGSSVSISGDYAIVGTGAIDYDFYRGSAFIFRRDGTAWSQEAKLVASDAGDWDMFGYSVSFSGDWVIVGAFMDDDKGYSSGSAYMFKYFSQQGLYGTVIGVDSIGQPSGPLADANLTLSKAGFDVNSSTDSLGSFSFLNIPAGEYTLKITEPNYWDSNNNIVIAKDETIYETFQLPYKSGSVSPVGYDFLSPNGRHFIDNYPDDITIVFAVSIIWNGSPGSVNFCIGDTNYPADVDYLGGGQFAKASKSITISDVNNFPSKLVIDVVNSAGNHTYLNTNIRFHPLPEIVNKWYGNINNWQTPGLSLSTSIGADWNWDLPLKNPKFTMGASLGYNRELSYDLMSGTFSGSFGGTGGLDMSLDVANVKILGEGQLDIGATLDIYLNDGEPLITPGWQIDFTGKAGLEIPVIVVVEVVFPPAKPAIDTSLRIPVVKNIVRALKVRFYLILGAGIEGKYEGFESGECFLGATEIDITGTLGAEIQVEISSGDAALGVYAGGSGTPRIKVCPELKFESIDLNAYVGVYAKMWWFRVSKRFGCTISFGEKENGMNLSRMLDVAGEPTVTWEYASDNLRRYGPANRPVAGTKYKVLKSKNNVTGTDAQAIAENVIDIAAPSVVSDPCQTMLLYVRHDTGKPDSRATDIGTFVSDFGAWLSGSIMDDDSSDYAARIISAAPDKYLAVWERIYGDVSQVDDPNRADEIGLRLEIAGSWFDRNTRTWSPLERITDNNVVDRDPMPVAFGSTAGVVWVQNDANLLGNSGSEDRLMFSEWTGSSWTAPQQLWSGPSGILSMSFASDNLDQGHIVFAVDNDSNEETQNDRELSGISTSSGVWGAAVRLTDNDLEDSCPVLVTPNGTPMLVWDCNNTLLYMPLVPPFTPQQVFSKYTLNNETPALAGVTMANGAAIAYTVQKLPGMDIMASFYDAALDRWSLPRRLTFDEDVESAISLGFDGKKLVVAYLKTLTERSDVNVVIDGNDTILQNMPNPGRTDLCILQHTLGNDLSVDSNSITFEPDNPSPGSAAVIKASIENSGDLGVENIPVAFYDGNPEIDGNLIDIGVITVNLLPGDSNEVSVIWNVPPDNARSHEIFVVVDPCLYFDDRNRSNNTASKFTILPDIKVVNAWDNIVSPNSIMLVARTANIGVASVNDVTVTWRLKDAQGPEIGSALIPALNSHAVFEATCLWDINGVFDNNDSVKIFGAASPANDMPELTKRNNTFTLVINNPGLSKQNRPPVACIVDINNVLEAQGPFGASITLDGSCSFDEDSSAAPNDDISSFNWYEVDPCSPGNKISIGTGQIIDCDLSLGRHNIILEVTDKAGASDSNEITITVQDTTAPNFYLGISPRTIWPPNHRMVKVVPNCIARDKCDSDPKITLVNITANEFGDMDDDIQIAEDGSIFLRAWRGGNSKGRIYTLTYEACDDSGNCTMRSVNVTVPHDSRIVKSKKAF